MGEEAATTDALADAMGAVAADTGEDEEILTSLHKDASVADAKLAGPGGVPAMHRAPTKTFAAVSDVPDVPDVAARSQPQSPPPAVLSASPEGQESEEARRNFRNRRLTRESLNQDSLELDGAHDELGVLVPSPVPGDNIKKLSRRISKEIDDKEQAEKEARARARPPAIARAAPAAHVAHAAPAPPPPQERERPLFPRAGALGTFSAHGIEPGEHSDAPVAKINQDCGCVCYPFADDAEQALMVVMDGHGPQGEKVSASLMHALVHHLENSELLRRSARQLVE